MHDIIDMQMIDTQYNLFKYLKSLFFLKPFLISKNLKQLFSFDQLSYKIEIFLILIQSIAIHDIRMILE